MAHKKQNKLSLIHIQMCIRDRHTTYSALLSRLSLAPDHKDNLLGRGLTETDIQCLGYKTTPVVGMTQIAKQLQSDGDVYKRQVLMAKKAKIDIRDMPGATWRDVVAAVLEQCAEPVTLTFL